MATMRRIANRKRREQFILHELCVRCREPVANIGTGLILGRIKVPTEIVLTVRDSISSVSMPVVVSACFVDHGISF